MRREVAPGIELDDDPARIDLDDVHRFLSRESYWARGRPRERIEGTLRMSARVVGLYEGGRQGGLARVVSDGNIAYLADVHRGFGFAEPDDPTLMQRPRAASGA